MVQAVEDLSWRSCCEEERKEFQEATLTGKIFKLRELNLIGRSVWRVFRPRCSKDERVNLLLHTYKHHFKLENN
jgi:hypothetical protein